MPDQPDLITMTSELITDLECGSWAERHNVAQAEADRLAEIVRAQAERHAADAREIARLKDELEASVLKLAACDVASISNTRETFEQQHLPHDSPHMTAAYLSVCAAIEREMAARERAEVAELEIVRLKQTFGGQ